MKFTIDTEVDSYERACEVVNTAYGRAAEPVLVTARPLEPGEVWSDPDRPQIPGWSEEQLRDWVRILWMRPDAALAVHWICGRAGSAVPSYSIDGVLAPGAGGGPAVVRQRQAWMNQALQAARSVGHRRMPFARDDARRTYTAAPEVAAIVLDALAKGPLHRVVLARAAVAEKRQDAHPAAN